MNVFHVKIFIFYISLLNVRDARCGNFEWIYRYGFPCVRYRGVRIANPFPIAAADTLPGFSYDQRQKKSFYGPPSQPLVADNGDLDGDPAAGNIVLELATEGWRCGVHHFVVEVVGLSEKADRPIEGYSGGEIQRLGIAQAQMNFPELLILDEPAAGLDPEGREQVLKIMESLRHESTIFYSTHILDDVQRVSDRVAILNKGNLQKTG